MAGSTTRQLPALPGVNEVLYNFEGPIGAGVPREVADAHRLVKTYRSLSSEIQKTHPDGRTR